MGRIALSSVLGFGPFGVWVCALLFTTPNSSLKRPCPWPWPFGLTNNVVGYIDVGGDGDNCPISGFIPITRLLSDWHFLFPDPAGGLGLEAIPLLCLCCVHARFLVGVARTPETRLTFDYYKHLKSPRAGITQRPSSDTKIQRRFHLPSSIFTVHQNGTRYIARRKGGELARGTAKVQKGR